MIKKFTIFSLLLILSQSVFADTLPNIIKETAVTRDYYAVLTCKGSGQVIDFQAFYRLPASSPGVPSYQNLVQLNPSRYKALTAQCRGEQPEGIIKVDVSLIHYPLGECRELESGCQVSSDCCQGYCDSQLGSCRSLVGSPSTPNSVGQ